MKLHHIAFWTNDIERLVAFYQLHFDGKILFSHQDGNFRCTFISICSSIRLEFMTKKDLRNAMPEDKVGFSHLSLQLNTKDEVNDLTDYFIAQGITLEKNKIQYDDGFYESSVFDPDGNIIELAYVDSTVNPDAMSL